VRISPANFLGLPLTFVGMVAVMTPEQIAEMGWDTQLPLSLEDSLNALETAVKSHVLDDLGVDFLNMYLQFKRLDAKQASEKSEEERLRVLSKIF